MTFNIKTFYFVNNFDIFGYISSIIILVKGGYVMIFSIIIISLIGTFAHFLYDLTNHNKVVGLFMAVNESTWEHIKIALTPTFLWSLYDGFVYGVNDNYFLAKLLSLLVLIIVIPLVFYTYKFFLKKSILVIDILLFYVSIILSQMMFYYVIDLESLGFIVSYLSCIGVFILFGFYMVLTLLPIKSFLFKDPISNKYGFSGHTEIFSKKE